MNSDEIARLIASLNPAQRAAVLYLDGPCLVIAGAGSGKTRVITAKMAHLMAQGTAPRAIAAITFTNKAAQEMNERLSQMWALRGRHRPWISTFHALGVQMLREDGAALGLKPAFSILDAEDAGALIAQALETTDRKRVRAAQAHISLWKNAGIGPAAAGRVAQSSDEQTAARAYQAYAVALAAYQAVDFDDLIGLPLHMLREHPTVAERWQNRLRYWLVDEYQDTNSTQYELLKYLVGPRGALTAVGDDDQSIYGWRGATLENLQRLSQEYPALHVIKLEQNYRSSRTILAAANRLISHNPKLHIKTLWSELGVGDPIKVLAMDDDEHEAESIALRIQAMKFERQASFRDFAVLYRGNHQARVLEQALRQARLPYVLSGGQSWFDRAEIRDVLAWMRLLANPEDDPALIRAITTPKRGIGPQSLQALGTYAAERKVSMLQALSESGLETRLASKPLEILQAFGQYVQRLTQRAATEPAGALLDEMLRTIGYHDHLVASLDDKQASVRGQNVTDFVSWIQKRSQEGGQSLLEIAQTIALLARLDSQEEDVDAIRLTTVHASKGLEFPHVFLMGCEEGLLPYQRDEQDTEDVEAGDLRVEEERRLMYVAVTRAQRTLTLSWCRQRRRAKAMMTRLPSRFISEMGLDPEDALAQPVSVESAKQKLAALKGLLRS